MRKKSFLIAFLNLGIATLIFAFNYIISLLF